MSLSSSSFEDVDGALDRGVGGDRLMIIDNGIPPTISVVAYRKSDGNRLDLRRFHSMLLFGKFLELCDRSDI